MYLRLTLSRMEFKGEDAYKIITMCDSIVANFWSGKSIIFV